jgi:hypothetical protein
MAKIADETSTCQGSSKRLECWQAIQNLDAFGVLKDDDLRRDHTIGLLALRKHVHGPEDYAI